MWELYSKINGKIGEKQKFSDFKEAKKAFRKAVKQAFDENPELLEHFIAQIDAYCDKYFPVKKRAKKPVPSSFDKLKNVLTNYVTNAAYNINPNVFSITNYWDKNIDINWSDMYDYDGSITLYTNIRKKKKRKPLMFPDIWIPLRFEDDESSKHFSITDNNFDGTGSLLPDTFSIYVSLAPVVIEEYFDEDDYDEDDDEDDDDYDDDDDEDYDDDDEEDYTPPVRSAVRQTGEKEAKHAAFLRCRNCVNERKCDIMVRRQTGPCGGYIPKEKKKIW